jgi:hypothetical protein
MAPSASVFRVIVDEWRLDPSLPRGVYCVVAVESARASGKSCVSFGWRLH